jgi:hypothetical protein
MSQTTNGLVKPPMRPLASTFSPPKPPSSDPVPVAPPASGWRVAEEVGVGIGVVPASDGRPGLAVAGPVEAGSVDPGESVGVGLAVGLGVALTGFRGGFGVGLGVAFGAGFGVALGVGLGVGFGVGFGVGAGVGFGVGGATTTTVAGTAPVNVQVVPPLRTAKLYGHVPTGRVRVPLKTTPALKFVPPGARSLELPLTWRRTHAGVAPVLSTTVRLNVKVVEGEPLPGETFPGPSVSVAQDFASTGEAKPTRDSAIQLVSAMAPTRLVRVWRRSIPRNQVSVS